MTTYKGKTIVSWTYEKCYDFIQDKYPSIYENNPEKYEDHGLTKYFDKSDEAFNQDYIMIIARFMIAFYYGGILVSSIDSITPSLVEDNLNFEVQNRIFFITSSTNNLMVVL